MTVREADGAVLESICPCSEARHIPQLLCRHCSALAEYDLLHTADNCKQAAPDLFPEEKDIAQTVLPQTDPAFPDAAPVQSLLSGYPLPELIVKTRMRKPVLLYPEVSQKLTEVQN